MKKIITDDRMQQLSGFIAQIFLTITQIGILEIILFRRYWLHQPESAYKDLRILLFISLFGYFLTKIYFGATLPMLSIKKLFVIYLVVTCSLTIILSAIFGIPQLSEFHNTLLPVLVGPAIIAVIYYLFARAGMKRASKDFDNE